MKDCNWARTEAQSGVCFIGLVGLVMLGDSNLCSKPAEAL